MTTDQYHDDDDILAAEYALRLLSGDELDKANTRLNGDPAFAQSVLAWEIRLTSLADDLPDEQSSTALKRDVMNTLFPKTARPSFWQGKGLWQAISGLSLVALAFVAITNLSAPKDVQGPLYTAEIVAEAGDFRVVAVVDKSTNEVFLTKTAGSAPEGRILQVWAHGPAAPALSVGLWTEGDTIRLPMPPTIAAVTGVLTLGVSEEPPGGSVTGSPSGRVFGTVDIPDVTS